MSDITLNTAVARVPGEASAPRTPPVTQVGLVGWLRANLFSSWISTAVTLVLAYLIIRWAVGFIEWGVVNAVWSVPNNQTQACRDLKGVGACWAVITEKHRFMLFGTYPYEEHWRPALVVLLFVGLYVVSAMRRFWRWELAAVWAVVLTLIGVPMCRGVPLISLLFMASVMFPLFLPEGMNIDKLLRAQIAIILFAGAYLAEVVRGGLQALPKGQYEAADALGLSYWQKTGFIILPQALRLVIPPLVNTFIGFFKDTSLVLIIGIFDLLTAGKTAIIEPAWQGFGVEVYVTVGAIYFVFCFAMSKYSQGLEAELNRHRRR